MCVVGSGNYVREGWGMCSNAEGFVVLFFTLVRVSFFVGCVLYIVDCYHVHVHVYSHILCEHIWVSVW